MAAIEDAYKLLSPLLGVAGASTLFAVALLASGQNSSITGTLAGQVVMEGFVNLRVAPWMRRMITRGIAILPTVIVVALMGERGDGEAAAAEPGDFVDAIELCGGAAGLLYRQGELMGEFVNGVVEVDGWSAAVVIAGWNVWLLVITIIGVNFY